MGRVLLEGVEKVYEGGVKAVSDFNLEVADGEFLVLVGPSGCGKSTTLRMIAGLEEVSAGTVTIGDRVVNGVHPKDRDIAMVFQDYALYPHMTVYQNMAFGLKLRRFRKPEIDRRVREAAEILGITDLLERRPKALSGGQRQRVAVGRTIVRKPAVFLFDEPLSNLDAKLRVQMRVEISQLHSQLGVTMIYVTHDQTEAMTMGDRIVVMKDGLIQQVADPMTLYDCPVNDFVAGFIGTPPINFFPGRIPAGGELVFEVAGGFALRLPEARRRGLEPHRDRPLRIGIRPEDIGSPAATAVPGAPRIAAAVRVVEPMGADTYVHLDAGGHRFVSRVDAHQRFRPGQAVSLPVFIDKAHFFDAGTHRRLTA